MKSKLAIFPFIALLIGCTSGAVPPTKTNYSGNWEAFSYTGFGDEVDALLGSSFNDCGTLNMLDSTDPANDGLTPSLAIDCIKKSIQTNTPFKFGSVRIPTDSFLFHTVVMDATGQFWIYDYDVMLDRSGDMRHAKKCSGIGRFSSSLLFEGIGCSHE